MVDNVTERNLRGPYEELRFCLNIWARQGYCTFGGRTDCVKCGVPYFLWKYVGGEVLHGPMKRLTLDDWQRMLESHTEFEFEEKLRHSLEQQRLECALHSDDLAENRSS